MQVVLLWSYLAGPPRLHYHLQLRLHRPTQAQLMRIEFSEMRDATCWIAEWKVRGCSVCSGWQSWVSVSVSFSASHWGNLLKYNAGIAPLSWMPSWNLTLIIILLLLSVLVIYTIHARLWYTGHWSAISMFWDRMQSVGEVTTTVTAEPHCCELWDADRRLTKQKAT